MKFWEHFFQTDEIKKQELTKIYQEIDMSDWNQVFSACLGKLLVIQGNAGDHIVKGRGCHLDFSKRSLFFGEDEYKFQLIGMEAAQEGIWHWGWEYAEQYSEEMLVLANEMRAAGRKWNLVPLSSSALSLNDTLNGHTLSIVTCGLSEENYFYYRAPYRGGAVYLAVEYTEKEVLNKVGITLFGQLILQGIHQYPVDHKIFAEALLQWNQTPYSWEQDSIVAKFPQELFLDFKCEDKIYRMTSIKTK